MPKWMAQGANPESFARYFLQNMRFWLVSFFEGFWPPKRHQKLSKSGNFGALGPDFLDFWRFFGTPFFKEFLVGF